MYALWMGKIEWERCNTKYDCKGNKIINHVKELEKTQKNKKKSRRKKQYMEKRASEVLTIYYIHMHVTSSNSSTSMTYSCNVTRRHIYVYIWRQSTYNMYTMWILWIATAICSIHVCMCTPLSLCELSN